MLLEEKRGIPIQRQPSASVGFSLLLLANIPKAIVCFSHVASCIRVSPSNREVNEGLQSQFAEMRANVGRMSSVHTLLGAYSMGVIY